jgi:hypothetical protein
VACGGAEAGQRTAATFPWEGIRHALVWQFARLSIVNLVCGSLATATTCNWRRKRHALEGCPLPSQAAVNRAGRLRHDRTEAR